MTDSAKSPSIGEQILAELRKMSKLAILANGDKLERELGKYANTNERKKAWVLIDGKNDIDELIKGSGLKQRAVYDFLEILEKAGFIEREHGRPPTRLTDHVPSEWISLLQPQPMSTLEQAIPPQVKETSRPAAQKDISNG